jgi:hypothetical protein
MEPKQPKKTETLEIRVAPETKSELQAKARREGQSVSEVLRGLIQTYLRARSSIAQRSWIMRLSIFATVAALISAHQLATPAAASDLSLRVGGALNATMDIKYGDGFLFCPANNSIMTMSPLSQCPDHRGIAFRVESTPLRALLVRAHVISPTDADIRFADADPSTTVALSAEASLQVVDSTGRIHEFLFEATKID